MSRWKVSNTQKAKYGPSGGHNGYGFRVETSNGAPLLLVSYDTEAEALEAEAAMRKIIQGAADVMAR
jgi:hypothetical protein